MYKKDLRTSYYIIKDGEVLGRVWHLDDAFKVCFMKRATYCCIYQHLVDIEDEWLYKLYLRYVKDELPEPPMIIEDMAREVFLAISSMKHPFIRRPPVRDLLREMFTVQDHWHKKEIETMCVGANWNSIRVALSQLRTEGINIYYKQDGIYVREQPA